jgi:hypothetical protein
MDATAASVDRRLGNMNDSIITVHDPAPDHVVLEDHESLTAPIGGLELHLALPDDHPGAVAWWMDEWGMKA